MNFRLERVQTLTMMGIAALVSLDCGSRVSDPMPSPIVHEATFAPNLNWPIGVAIGREGRIYIADGNNNRVVVLGAAGTFEFQMGPPGSRTVVNFDVPMGIATDDDGFVYVTDSNNHRVLKFSADGSLVDSVGTAGVAGSELGRFDVPTAIAVGPGRILYVGETGNSQHRIQKLTLDLDPVFSWGRFGSQNGQFNDPNGIATDSEGRVYVADFDNARIQVFASDSTFLWSFGSRGAGPGQFDQPRGLVVDADSRLYVTDGMINQTSNSRVQIFTPEGRLLGAFGGPGNRSGQFNTPWGIAVKGNRLLVVDRTNHRLQSFRVLPRALTN